MQNIFDNLKNLEEAISAFHLKSEDIAHQALLLKQGAEQTLQLAKKIANVNTCEECGKTVQGNGLCQDCDSKREHNREDYTGVPGLRA